MINGWNVVISRSSRKSIAISVRQNLDVIVCVPKKTDDKAIYEILVQKQNWIQKKLEYFQNSKTIFKVFGAITDGQKIYFLGNEVVVRIMNIDRNVVTFDGEVIAIYSHFANAHNVLNKWVEGFAAQYFEERLNFCFERFLQKVPCKFPVLKIRKMKKRWGSMSTSGVMVLNLALVFTPSQCIDYVIMHEICHIKHMNHGKKFYELQGYFTPNYKEIKKELERFVVA